MEKYKFDTRQREHWVNECNIDENFAKFRQILMSRSYDIVIC